MPELVLKEALIPFALCLSPQWGGSWPILSIFHKTNLYTSLSTFLTWVSSFDNSGDGCSRLRTGELPPVLFSKLLACSKDLNFLLIKGILSMFLKTVSLSAEFNIKCCFCVLGARSLDLTALVAEEYFCVDFSKAMPCAVSESSCRRMYLDHIVFFVTFSTVLNIF